MNFEERISHYFSRQPSIHPTAFVAQGAAVHGNVSLGEESSVWYHTSLRGDINSIEIGPRSNIQDGSVVHVADDYGTRIGEYVTCGHQAIVHACTVGNEVLIGMGAIILDGVEIGPQCIIGANALVTMGTKIPEGSLLLGSPAKIVKQLDRETRQSIREWAERYVILSRRYLERRSGGEFF